MIVRTIQVKSVMTKSSLPVGGYSVNPYVGCPHACQYCYASFMKRFTGHREPWGTFLDVKYWPEIKHPEQYAGRQILIGSVTDGYHPLEEKYRRTRAVLEQLVSGRASVTICTKSDLVTRDLDLLTQMKDVTVSFSLNTTDENFRADMDKAVSVERRLSAMKQLYEAGIRTVCFLSPIFPGITDVEAVIERTKDRCDFIWLENLNLRGEFKPVIFDYIKNRYPRLLPLYEQIYIKRDKTYWKQLESRIRVYAEKNDLPYLDNYLPQGRSTPGHPAVINYLYHEEVRGSANTGIRRTDSP